MSNNISTKPISKLLGMNFFIPAYQRGYRWTEQQVRDLLNDIWGFIESDPTKEEWYCLQPIVVKARNEQWEVIDGQQRLTTIFLVLKYLEKFVESERKTFELEYETRNTEKSNSKDFLNNVDQKAENEALDNIDYFHIYKAFEVIKEWFKKKAEAHSSVSSNFIKPFLEKTKVIWYETNEDDAVQIFTRINMGKIALTNAELIKALFLNSSNFKTNNIVDKEKIRLKQLEIANEWDFIEYSLHNEEFWLFINKDENEQDTRIEFLFELIVGKPTSKEDDTYTFRKYAEKFQNKSEKEIKENWKQVKRCFQTLQDWFNDRELYHKIGFLVTFGENIKTLIEKSQSESKTEFIEFVDGKINGKFTNVQLAKIEYGNGIIRPILLLHNIQTMLKNTKENSRFPFNRYKKEKWDIEHIHAKASEAKVKDELEEQRNWLIENFEKDESVHNNYDLNKRIKSLIDNELEKKDENFQEIIEYVLGEEDDFLRNLCLLDRGTNRSYKNDAFKMKRKKIIEQEKFGTFIPICTRNVFMKYYSNELKQLGHWSETDRTAYFENIKEVLKPYLPTQND
ncbi:DUF262 domain-containing protein [Avrilella dinanensis]|uniref:GmrSD restriction endonucleases N-terminal domain-containing protein n=1 Tax=Avrilella dinanensis TaxID=2008672 RepID=A0A2M9R2Q0_9FLAO|nr:DUF262 domain-containing protein [Avrilella dinanensis]PJR03137.1 hypothetical protein CDL10_00470 [Avrilella dinanensis]